MISTVYGKINLYTDKTPHAKYAIPQNTTQRFAWMPNKSTASYCKKQLIFTSWAFVGIPSVILNRVS